MRPNYSQRLSNATTACVECEEIIEKEEGEEPVEKCSH